MVNESTPYNEKVERNVLGALITSERALVNNIQFLSEDCFYLFNNKKIFNAIISLFNKNQNINILSLENELKKYKKASEEVIDLSSEASVYNIQELVFILKEYKIRRELIILSTETNKKCADQSSDVLDALEDLTKKADNISMSLNIKQIDSIEKVLAESIKEIEEAGKKDGRVKGITSGFRDIDNITSGWSNSDFVVVAGRPSMGKSCLARSFVMNALLLQDKNIAFFSLEESKAQVGKKMLSSMTDIPYEKIKLGSLSENDWNDIHKSIGLLEKKSLTIDDTSGLSVFELKSKCRMLNHQKKLDMVVIDYLQLMRGDKGKGGTREQEISHISRSLKGLAKELNIPIIALAQLSRAVETRSDKKPMLSDLRESGSIEQDADLVGFIYRPEYYGFAEVNGEDITGQAKFIIAKHRSGELGEPKLKFEGDKARFSELELQF